MRALIPTPRASAKRSARSATGTSTAAWALRVSNPRPPPCKGGALPAELNALRQNARVVHGTATERHGRGSSRPRTVVKIAYDGHWQGQGRSGAARGLSRVSSSLRGMSSIRGRSATRCPPGRPSRATHRPASCRAQRDRDDQPFHPHHPSHRRRHREPPRHGGSRRPRQPGCRGRADPRPVDDRAADHHDADDRARTRAGTGPDRPGARAPRPHHADDDHPGDEPGRDRAGHHDVARTPTSSRPSTSSSSTPRPASTRRRPSSRTPRSGSPTTPRR